MSADIPDPRPDLNDAAHKEEYFRYEVNAFLDLAIKIGQIAHKTDLEYGTKKVEEILELAGPGYFKQILAHPKTDIKYLYSRFEIAFASRRKSIIKGLDDLSWTVHRGYTILYGAANDPKFKMIQIPIDVIFALAKENLSVLEDKLAETEIKPELYDDETKYELKHHILLLLHLLRLFFTVSIGADRITLAIMIKNLEDNLNMVIGERCIPVSANLGTTSEGGLAGGVGQAFGTISNLMRSIGINPPEGVRPPTDAQLSTIISGVFNNPALQQTVQSSMAGLQNSSNTNDVVANIMGNIIKADVLQDITQATTSTVEQALNQSPTAAPPGNLEDTLKNFVSNVAQSAGAQSPADLANMPVNLTPGIAPGSHQHAGHSHGATSSSAPGPYAPMTAPTAPINAPVPLATPQIVSSVPAPKVSYIP